MFNYFCMVVMTPFMLWMAEMSSLNLLLGVDSLARVGLLLLVDVVIPLFISLSSSESSSFRT